MAPTSRNAVRRLAAARLISITGGSAAYLTLNYTIYERTGSAAWVAAALLLTFGTVGLTAPFAGALGDRFDRKKVMIASDLAGAACFLAMSLVDAPWLLLVWAFGSALAEAPFLSSSSAAIPNLVEERDIGWANGLVAVGRNTGILIGPLIGGVMVAAMGAGTVFLVNAISFVLSAAMIATVRGRFNDESGSESEHQGLRAGFRFLFRERVLRTAALAWLALVLGLGMTMVADVPLVELFDAGSFGYGVLIACFGAGSIVGSLTGRFLRGSNEVPAFLLGSAVVAATSVAVGLSPWFAMVLGAILVFGVGDGVAFVAQQGIMQRRAPDAVRSRVAGAFDAVVHLGLAVSYIVAGPAVALLGARGVYLVGGVIALVGVGIALPILRTRVSGEAIPADRGTETAEIQQLLVP